MSDSEKKAIWKSVPQQKKAADNVRPVRARNVVTGEATLKLNFSDVKSAQAAYDALLAEADFSHRGGSKVILSKKSVEVGIKADDPVSLRASINSYLRLMHIIKTVDENIE